jgi:hypothetical protein
MSRRDDSNCAEWLTLRCAGTSTRGKPCKFTTTGFPVPGVPFYCAHHSHQRTVTATPAGHVAAMRAAFGLPTR